MSDPSMIVGFFAFVAGVALARLFDMRQRWVRHIQARRPTRRNNKD